MDRSNDRKIADWLGWRFSHEKSPGQLYGPWYWINPPQEHGNRVILPYFEDSDADAISLFPVLLARGYVSALFVAHTVPDQWQCDIAKSTNYDAVARGIQPTIAQAISAAVLQLIESI